MSVRLLKPFSNYVVTSILSTRCTSVRCISAFNFPRKHKRRKSVCLLQNRQFSLEPAVESIVRTQTGIFQTISESTPVGYFQKFLLTLHETTGLPWWGTIITATVLLRTSVTLPLAIYQNYIMAKVENLNLEMPEILKELKVEMAYAIRQFQWDERTAKFHFNRAAKKQWNKLIVRENCHPFKAGLLLWFQIPMWVCLSVSLRNLVYMLPVPDTQAQITLLELSVGGFAWIPNLVQTDSSWILPVTLGVVNLMIIELQSLSKVTVPTRTQRYFTNIFRGVSLLMVPIAACVPSCLALYWTTSSVYGLIQNLVLMSPKVKRKCRIPKTASELEEPYKYVLAGLKRKLIFLQKTD